MANYNRLTDHELLDLLKEGDPDAFTEIYDRYKDMLHRYAYRWLQDREAVKDAIQELFTLIWKKRDTLVFNQNLSGYLYTAVRNAIVRKISQDKRAAEYQASLQTYIDNGENITDYKVRESQLRAIIETEVTALPKKMREVFELSRNAQLSHAEIAGKLGITEQSVRSHIKNALKILRKRLGILIFIYLIIHW